MFVSRRGAMLGALCAALLGLAWLASPSLLGAEWWLFDRYSVQLAKSRRPDPRIVLVTVSDAATRALAGDYGRPQEYSREVYARAIGELLHDGARVVALDIFFAEENETAPEGDRDLAARLAGAPVVLGAQTNLPTTRTTLAAASAEWAPKLWDVTLPPPTANRQPPTAYNLIAPHPLFRDAAGVGTMRLGTSAGSAKVHRYPLADRIGDRYVASLGLEAARLFLGRPRTATWREALHEDELRFGPTVVPVDDDLEMLIRWNGAKARPDLLSYPNVDLDKVILASLLREEQPNHPDLTKFAEQFRGKIVLVGFTAAGLLDLRPNPLSSRAAGLELHANAVDNLINGDFNRVANRWLMLPLILVIGAGFGAGIDRARSQLVSALVAIAGIVLVVLLGYFALARGFVVPAFTAAATIALTHIVITVVSFVAEQKQTAVLKTTFGRYVSPQILEHVLAHPEKVHLGGERRELSILFSDIRGFTTISEANEPEAVVEMLNEYLTRMVDILLAHGGTLDKFIGDAVMGFWNAPAPDPDHARHAVACAVEMVEETARLRAEWEKTGKASIRIGVGVNTGEAVVGNIGSERVFGYTVIGDAVNLASRLESKNKDYVTEIIISEFTMGRIGGAFPTVYVDEVKVKGKENAVKIYEVKVHA
ncbi:MAG: adenylate cyclase [Acidobacteriota bacterium]|jgi:adenylate cyclase|nr:adenylate cyclase [Acidobacteriota bacterium]